ncbi:hypothetical protein [Janthinobacterium sp.]|uniref:hypothetical protein n=1 Tax=Janthinobacterium sp. TaxID=1871054 RepID=UPI00293D9455|nr:hypothetical protein [Janthinobacterium sp.]
MSNPTRQRPLYGPAPRILLPLKSGRPGRVKAVLCLVLLTASAVGGRMWWRSYYFEQTDNAYLAGHVGTISSRIPGVVSKVLVSEKLLVHQD